MLIFGKQITDECSRCGKVLECELFRQGHGIKCDRQNISKMLECQFEHREKRENDGISGNTQNWQKGRLVMYRLERKGFCISKNQIAVIPTIWIAIDNMEYKEKNFSIEFHFLIIHTGLLFIKQGQVTYSIGKESCLLNSQGRNAEQVRHLPLPLSCFQHFGQDAHTIYLFFRDRYVISSTPVRTTVKGGERPSDWYRSSEIPQHLTWRNSKPQLTQI